MRAIDADHLKRWILSRVFKTQLSVADVIDQIDREDTIKPERKKGKWIEYDNSHCECPFCHEEWSYFDNEVEHFNFCPNCGADMREEQDG